MEIKRKTGVILALDVEEKERAHRICQSVSRYVDAIKVGYPTVLACGIGILKEISLYSKPVIADFKVADIPEISRKICKLAIDNGANFVIVHGFVGEDVIRACSEVARIFVVADMSHRGALDFISKESKKIAMLAKKYAYGIVAPATRVEQIRKLRKIVGELTIISPGIKSQGAKPGSAISAGADFEIVGRSVYCSTNPKKAVLEILEMMANVKLTKPNCDDEN